MNRIQRFRKWWRKSSIIVLMLRAPTRKWFYFSGRILATSCTCVDFASTCLAMLCVVLFQNFMTMVLTTIAGGVIPRRRSYCQRRRQSRRFLRQFSERMARNDTQIYTWDKNWSCWCISKRQLQCKSWLHHVHRIRKSFLGNFESLSSDVSLLSAAWSVRVAVFFFSKKNKQL